MSDTDKGSVSKLPLGKRFLALLQKQEERCLVATDNGLVILGKTVPATVEHLGTVLSLLDRVGSCFWGCHGGDHVAEFIGARCCSTARAALRLLRHGYYDESLSLTRSLAEAANLLFLFKTDKLAFADWRTADHKKRRSEFSPVRVRLRLEQLGSPAPADADRYSEYCEIGTHITPAVSPQAHGAGGINTMGGYYQPSGALLALNELAGMLGCAAAGVASLVELPTEIRKQLLHASVDLLRNVGGVSVHSVKGVNPPSA